ncbi:hypothetical protein [Soonwooa buanensis]|nr:hypothetical protein [Soonwooa buanensis]
MHRKKEENENITADYTINGIDYKTELQLGIGLGVIIICVFIAIAVTPFLMSNVARFSLVGLAGTIVAGSFLYLKFIMNFIKNKVWTIKILDDRLYFNYGQKETIIPLSDILKIKNVGNSNVFRYLSFYTKNSVVKIRVGNGGFTPFSKEEDVSKLDQFFEELLPYINKNFNKKEAFVKPNQFSFKNMGVYVHKSEKIHYNIIERMGVTYYIVGLFICAGLFLSIVFSSVEILQSYSRYDKFPSELTFINFFFIMISLLIIYSIAVYLKISKHKKD